MIIGIIGILFPTDQNNGLIEGFEHLSCQIITNYYG